MELLTIYLKEIDLDVQFKETVLDISSKKNTGFVLGGKHYEIFSSDFFKAIVIIREKTGAGLLEAIRLFREYVIQGFKDNDQDNSDFAGAVK